MSAFRVPIELAPTGRLQDDAGRLFDCVEKWYVLSQVTREARVADFIHLVFEPSEHALKGRRRRKAVDVARKLFMIRSEGFPSFCQSMLIPQTACPVERDKWKSDVRWVNFD